MKNLQYQRASRSSLLDCSIPKWVLIEAYRAVPVRFLFSLYRLLSDDHQTGIPNAFWFGVEGGYNIFVMERLGPSLEDIFTYCSKRLSVKTCSLLGEQMISRIEYCQGNPPFMK
mmetsp:Transcript_10633/g.9057  ORF Transcript_10633/g.9057 Transcript_10633/m.9057 type:complete len:114 (+) Transcript_10633:73-414(+)